MEKTFEKELEALINKYSVESESDTPDFILASFIRSCLNAWASTTLQRDAWHGFCKG